MFSNLFASVIISCGVACSTPRIEKPRQALNNNYLTGGFVVKNVDTSDIFFNSQLFDNDVSINFLTLGSGNYDVYGICLDSSDSYGFLHYDKLTQFVMYYYSSNNRIDIDLTYERNNYEITFNIFADFDFTDVGSYFGNFGFTFTSLAYLNAQQLELFNVVFTNQLNHNFYRYTGWYTFNGNASQTNLNSYLKVISLMSFDNQLYDIFSLVSVDNNYINLTFANSGVLDFSFQAINESVWRTNSRRVHLDNALISITDYELLERIGGFTFSDTSSYDLSDLFFDIGDTPVVFITGLFDFELFGINFAVAFMGIITIVIMVFLIRKVV